MIKGVIFDFGNVLYRFDNMIFVERISKRSPYSKERIQKILYEESSMIEDYESGRISSVEFFRSARKLLRLDISVTKFKRAFTDIFTPITETLELIPKLKKDYSLGLLSNTNEWDFEHCISEIDIFPFFDAVSLSYVVGAKKPDPRIFMDCLNKIGLEPEECIYIDDIETYSKKATSMGMTGHTYIDHEGLVSFLEDEGIIL
jgi:putative hydrolase of the HAD superfamily